MNENEILVVYSNLGLGGIPRKIVDIVNYMAVHKPLIKITVLLKKNHKFNLTSQIKNDNLQLKIVNLSSLHFLIRLCGEIYTKNYRSILVFISPYALPVLLLKFVFFWKHIHVVVSEDHFTSTMINFMKFPIIQKLGIRLLYPFADRIVVPTTAVGKNLQEQFGINNKNIEIIPNWSIYTSQKINYKQRNYDTIYFGRIEKTKNISKVIDTLAAVKDTKKSNLRSLLIGEGSESIAVEETIRERNMKKNIFVYSAKHNISHYLKKTKICIFTPQINTEGFPIALLDAMACGAIVVTLPFYGVDEVLKNNSNGFIEEDIEHMTRRISLILKHYNTYSRVIRLAKQHVVHYNADNNIIDYIRLLNV